MRHRPARRGLLVGGAWAIAALGAAFMTTLAVTMSEIEVSGPWLATFTALGAVVVSFASVGAILAVRRPENVVGLILLASGPLLVMTFSGFLLGAWFTEVNGPDDSLAQSASVIASLAVTPTMIIAGPVLALLFPDGQLPGPRWRWPVAALGFLLVLGTLMPMVRPGPLNIGLANNPFGISGQSWVDPVATLGTTIAFLVLGAALLVAVTATVVRFRRGDRVEREQIKWFVAANAATVTLLLVIIVDPALDVTWISAVGIASLALPPIAVGIAILRYRLYDIDRLIARSVSWTVVTGVLVTIFASGVAALQVPLAEFVQGQTLAVAASTLVAFALFQPLRRRVQSAVDQRFDRTRYDAEQTVAGFSDRLRDEVDISTVTTDLQATVHGAVKPASLRLWIRRAGT